MNVGRITFASPRDPWDALDEIRSRHAIPARPPNSFTIAEYCERYGLNRQTAVSQLEGMVVEGKLQKSLALVNHKRANVYWIPEQCASTKPTARRKK